MKSADPHFADESCDLVRQLDTGTPTPKKRLR